MPTYDSWSEAIKQIKRLTRSVTREQLKLAKYAGIALPRDLPSVVGAARLKRALEVELAVSPVTSSTDSQLSYLRSLNAKCARNKNVREDQDEAKAWIDFYQLSRREKALEKLQLESGDIVMSKDSGGERLSQVISIGSSGRLYFKGGQGASAWPDRVLLRSRKSEDSISARRLRRAAANQASARYKITGISSAKEQELAEFKINMPLTEDDVEQLQETIDAAKDERPIQLFLETHPQILAALLSGRSRFVVPRPQLGGRRIPDFFISDVDSLGIRWLLVELETPISPITLKNDNVLDKFARKGLSQIDEWRNWILKNLELARRSRREEGLGLIDIRPRSEGLVLVGRRSRLNQNADIVRHSIHEEQRVRIHTYDWLVETLHGVLAYDGPPVLNTRTIPPWRDEEDEAIPDWD